MNHATITLAVQTDKPLAAYGPLAAAVEAYGFDGVTVYNDMLYQPAWLPLLEMAKATQRVRVGVAAVNPFTCHPINIAGNIALIDEAAQGRAYLGLARGSWLDFVGLEPQRGVTALREALKGNDLDAIGTRSNELAESLQRVGAAAYQADQAAGGPTDGSGPEAGNGTGAEGAEADAESTDDADEAVEGEFNEV